MTFWDLVAATLAANAITAGVAAGMLQLLFMKERKK